MGQLKEKTSLDDFNEWSKSNDACDHSVGLGYAEKAIKYLVNKIKELEMEKKLMSDQIDNLQDKVNQAEMAEEEARYGGHN